MPPRFSKPRFPRTANPVSHAQTKTVYWRDFSGGVCTVNKGRNLHDNQLADGLNMKFTDSNYGVGLMSREGYTPQSSVGLGGPIRDIGFYEHGTTTDILCTSTSVLYKLGAAGSWSTVNALSGPRACMNQIGIYQAVADGGYLKYWDGTNFKMAVDDHGYLLAPLYTAACSTYSPYTINNSTYYVGQRFTTPAWDSGHTLTHTMAKFTLAKYGGPTMPLYYKVYKTSDSSLVASGMSITPSMLTTSPVEYEFPIAATLQPNTQYDFVLYSNSYDASNYVKVYKTTGSGCDGEAVSGTSLPLSPTGSTDVFVKLSPGLPPKCSIAFPWNNRLWVDDLDNPDFIRYSQIADPNYWDLDGDDAANAAGFVQFRGHRGVTALQEYRSRLMVHFGYGNKAVHWVSGSSPSDFTSSLAMDGVGALSQAQACNVGNDHLFVDGAVGCVSFEAWDAYGDVKLAAQSDPVRDRINENVTNEHPAGVCLAEQQFWVDYGASDGTFAVYDAQRKDPETHKGIWTFYRLNLGTDVTPTAFASYNGQIYIGDSAGHLHTNDIKDPTYYDGPASSPREYEQFIKLKETDFGTDRYKQALYVRVEALSRQGGAYKIKLYRDMEGTAFHSIDVSLGLAPDLTVDEATFIVDDATMTLDEKGASLQAQRVNFEYKSLQVGVEDIDTLDSPFLVHGVSMEVAQLSRR